MTLLHENFVYTGLPARVVFGFGTRARIGEELARLGVKRPMLVSTSRSRADALRAELRIELAGVFDRAAMHTPVHVTEQALAAVTSARADGLIALGGGSATGLGKAIALRTDLPQLVIPTTYAGSELTPVLGETSEGRKRSQSSPKVLPEAVIYDVELTLTLPPAVSAASGMNAIAHAVEALYAQERNPITSLMAIEGLRALAQGLPVIVERPLDRAARAEALYGAWLCSAVLGSVGMALHHKICHVLGGSFDMRVEERRAVQHLLLEFFQVQVNHRRHVERDELRDDEPADDHQAERPARSAVGAVAERDRAPRRSPPPAWSSGSGGSGPCSRRGSPSPPSRRRPRAAARSRRS